ncbi:hypothetical protein MAHJHV63_52830 [Mycobacterium avium subsp. hominissuis]
MRAAGRVGMQVNLRRTHRHMPHQGGDLIEAGTGGAHVFADTRIDRYAAAIAAVIAAAYRSILVSANTCAPPATAAPARTASAPTGMDR